MMYQGANRRGKAAKLNAELNGKIDGIVSMGAMLQQVLTVIIEKQALTKEEVQPMHSLPTIFVTRATYNQMLEHARCFGACNIKGGTDSCQEMEVCGLKIRALEDGESVLMTAPLKYTGNRYGPAGENHGDED